MPKVSVLFPLYKTNETHLRESINSVLNQTFTDFELLLLDDCPQDDRSAIVAEFDDPRIRYEKNERNMGITPTRNKLISMAKGEYLATMDHDDLCLPERLEKQVAYLDAHPEVGVVSSIYQILGTETIIRHPEHDADIKLNLIAGECSLLHPASMTRKSVLEEHGIRYEERFSPCEDYALWCDLIPHTRFHNIQEVLFLYRHHEGNTSHNNQERMQKLTISILTQARLNNPVLWQYYQQQYSRTITRCRVLGFLPLLKKVSCANAETVYLFSVIPLWSTKSKVSSILKP